jgi:hypothetical protein
MSLLFTDEMVEKAAEATWNTVVGPTDWAETDGANRALELQGAREALNAVAPLIAAKALKDAVEEMRRARRGSWNLPDPEDPETFYSVDVWLERRADQIEGQP